MKRVACRFMFAALALAALLAPQPAAAQEEGTKPLLWISYVTAEEGKSTELGMTMASEGAKIYDGLVADGHAMSWGVAQPINHYPGDDWTHMEWVNFRDWAAVNEFVKRFMAGQQAMSAEERAASAAKWAELTVHGSHYDAVHRHQHVATSGKRPGYIALSSFKAQQGQGGDEVAATYKKWRAPLMDKLMADGKVIGHGVLTTEMHGPGDFGNVTGWYAMADLGGEDAVAAAVRAADATYTEEQKAEWRADMKKTFQAPSGDTHTDRTLVVLHYHSAATSGDASE